MRFPYSEVRPGTYRPLIAVRLWGSRLHVLTDGVLDTGADRVLLKPKVAVGLGIDIDALRTDIAVRTATGELVRCKATILPIELIRDGVSLYWLAEIAIALDPIRINHWGFKGFLEYFSADFNGPERQVKLTAGDNLPVTTPPS